jgi:hypothetical protein
MKTNIFSISLILAVYLFLFTTNVSAQEERNFHIPVDTVNYNLYTYPPDNTQINVPYGFEVSFSISNGKYFYLQFEDVIGFTECNIDVYFYTPDGKQISKQHIKYLHNSYNIAQNAKSIKSSELKVKILNNGKINRNFKMMVAVPKDAVNGTPQVTEYTKE